MSRWRNNGGWNKTHGTVEKTPRIDSFEVAEVGGRGTVFTHQDGKAIILDCDHWQGPDREVVELYAGKWAQTLELSQKANGYGGSQTFFLCPACGRRVRYLYLTGVAFQCRKCSRLNYRSQQETQSGSMYFYDKGMDFVEKHLDRWPRVRLDGFSFCDWVPDRPRYMHQTTYRRYMRRFLRYRKKHTDRQIEDIQRILRMGG